MLFYILEIQLNYMLRLIKMKYYWLFTIKIKLFKLLLISISE